MPKIVDKEKMNQSIMQAAQRAFVMHGFHKTTMDKIAKEAGIAKGTLYLYFDSKESLSQHIMISHLEIIKRKLTSENHFESLDALLLHIEKGLIVSKQELRFIPILFEAFGSSFASKDFTQEIAGFFNQIGRYYALHLQVLIDQKAINSTINPDALGRVLVSMLDGIVLHKGLFKHSEKQYEAMVKEMINLLRHGI